MKKLISVLLIVISFSICRAQNKIKAWEYWFDDGSSSLVQTLITPVEEFTLSTNINTNFLEDGLHCIQFRFIDENDLCSSIASQLFYKYSAVSEEVSLTEVEYWIDNDRSNTKSEAINGQTIIWEPEINLAGLQNGLHTINIRAKDSNNKWSAITSKFFIVKPNTATANLISWQYWFDNNIETATTTDFTSTNSYDLSTSIDISNLATGMHILNIRFKDDQNKWSSPVSKFFYLKESNPDLPNSMVAIQYWLDDNLENTYTEILESNQSLTITDAIDFTTLVAGTHTIHFRFLDKSDVWSSAISNTFIKESLSIEDGLIAHYPLDANGEDQSVYQHHGTLNETTSTTDRFGNANAAIYFDGDNDYIRISDADHLDINNNESFSVSLWLKQEGANTDKYFLSKYNPSLGSNGAYGFGTGYTGDAYSWLYFNDDGGTENRGAIELNDGNWHHYVAVYKPGESISIFIDNQLDIQQTVSYTGNTTNSTDLFIGCGANIAQYFTGSLDDIRIYKRALSTEEINGLYDYIPTSAANNYLINIKVYPNPASDQLHIDLGENKGASICIYSSTGTCVYNTVAIDNKVRLPVSHLTKGLYLIEIKSSKGRSVSKVIIE
ncbi:LamG-like jellyroll fold domain-containing protein [Carboxylicivirga linearis]|uniref:T9SS type A sorting domain-containing protein n=1 Tax=Carboxylicivirga linearis TaxID=1628157 RepID=A0ABS5JYL7_9BACT|nr:LamG-like jellyroll fold domain-containing protein [Carboxylicivirga linearis]MBS2099934.1 T9SS type A sorting domain-containing protein [Carboxylicivirga linearis]